MNAYSISVAGADAGVPPGSGFGITIPGYFAGMNAKFGFNDSPHTFDIDVVQDSFGGSLDSLPEIGTAAKFYIGPDFFTVAGRVTHVEYSDTMSGTTATISLQDRRKDLDNVSVFTEDQGGLTALDNRGILSVGSYLRESQPGSLISEDRRYVLNNEEGATYEDLRATIVNSPYVSGLGFDPENLFPESTVVEGNLPVTASGLDVSLDLFRWKFDGAPLRSVLTTVLGDLGFDWYWLLEGERVALVNRAVDFQITQQNIPIPNSSGYTTNLRWGIDDTDADDYVGILGARQEGFIDSDLLSPIDGLATPSGVKFVKAWDNLTVGFYDSAGLYKKYKVVEKELPLAMKGFDYWSVFKKHQTTLGYAADAGFLAAQDPNFQSRIDDKFVDQAIIDLIVAGGDITDGFPTLTGTQTNLDSLSATNKALVLEKLALTNYYSGKKYIPSKRSQNQNWIIQWYEKVKNLAENYYGRVYAAEGILIDETYGLFSTMDRAWGNVENQLSPGTSFGRNYQLDSSFQPLTPFIGEDTRVGAYAVLPAYTAYGKDGSEAPDAFDRWNVDAAKGFHYVPVNLQTVDNFVKDPRAAESPFLTYEPGTVVCQFGKIPGEALLKDISLSSNPFVSGIFNENINAQVDFLDPTYLIKPYEYFDGSIEVPAATLSTSGVLSTATMGEPFCYDQHNSQNVSIAGLPGGSGIIAYETIATKTTASDTVTYKNLLLDSNDFSTSNWAKPFTIVTTKNFAGPFGAPFEATLLDNRAGTINSKISQSFSIESGKSYTFSLFVKSGVRSGVNSNICELQVETSGGTTSTHTMAALVNEGVFPTLSVGVGSPTLHPVQDMGQDWYRIAFTVTNVDDTTATFHILPYKNQTGFGFPLSARYAAVRIYGAQVEEVVSGNVIDYPSEYLGHATSAKQTYTGTQGYGDGYSVAVAASGTTMVVGAPMTAASGVVENVGAIHIYDKVGSSWELSQTIHAPSGVRGDHFGFDVDIDGDGDTIVVGAPGYKVSTATANPSKVGRGYIYEKSGGSFILASVAEDAAVSSTHKAGQLGWSVAVDDSGERALFGAPFRTYAARDRKLGGFDFYRKVSGVWGLQGGSDPMYGSVPVTSAWPKAYYKLNDGGGTSWSSGGGPRQCYEGADAAPSPHNYYGTLANGPTWVSNGGVSGPTCHSLHFDRSSGQFVNLGSQVGTGSRGFPWSELYTVFTDTTPWTMSAWFKLDNLVSGNIYTISMFGQGNQLDEEARSMIVSESSSGAGDWRLGTADLLVSHAWTSAVFGTTPIQPGVWYHGVVTCAGGTLGTSISMNVYLNGSLEGTGTIAYGAMGGWPAGSNSHVGMAIGASVNKGPGWSSFFDGQLSDVGFWNIALNATEAEDLYNKQVGFDSGEKYFGYSLDISPDGTQAIIGTKYSDQVVIVDRTGATPATESFDLTPGATNHSHIINPPGFDPTINPARSYSATWGTSTGHGNSVSIANGKRIVIGAPLESLSSVNDNKGAAYIYDYNETDSKWELFDKIYDIGGASHSNFGHSVSISPDGKIVTVGQIGETSGVSARAGAIQVWDEQTGRFMLNKKLFSESPAENNYYGRAIDVNKDGSIVAIGAGPWQAPDGGFREPGDLPNEYVGKPTTLTLSIPAPSKSGKSLGGWNDEIPLSYANVTEFKGKVLSFQQDGSAPTYWGDEVVFHEGPINCLDIEPLYQNTPGSGVFVLGYGSAASGVHALIGKVENDTISVLSRSTASSGVINSEIGPVFDSGAQEISVSHYLDNNPATATGEFIVAYKNSLGNFLNIAGSGYNNLSSIQWGGADEPGGTFRTGGYGVVTSAPVIDVDSTELRSDTITNIYSSEWEEVVYSEPSGVGSLTNFGNDVKVSRSGNVAIVGSDHSDATTVSDAGSIYVYEKKNSQWVYSDEILDGAGPSASAWFGLSVDLSSAGTKIVGGSPLSDPSATSAAGSISAYDKVGDNYILDEVITSSTPVTNEQVGIDISISSDGQELISTYHVAGAPLVNGWYCWTRASGSWAQQSKIGSGTSNYIQKDCIKISGNGLVAVFLEQITLTGQAVLRIFTRASTASAFTAPSTYYSVFDSSVLNTTSAKIDVSSDGSVIVVGSPHLSSGLGGVLVFKTSPGVYGPNLFQVLSPPDGNTSARYGSSVRVSSDGKTILASSTEVTSKSTPGRVYMYSLDGGRYTLSDTFVEKIKPGDISALRRVGNYGSSVSCNDIASDVLISTPFRTDPSDNSASALRYASVNFYTKNSHVSAVRASGVESTLAPETTSSEAGFPLIYGSGIKLDDGYSSSVSIDRVYESGVISAYNLKTTGAPLYSGKTDLLSITSTSGVITSLDNDTFTLADPVGVSIANIDSSKINIAYLSNLTKVAKVRSLNNVDNISIIGNDLETVLGTSMSPFISKYNNAIDIAHIEESVFGTLHNDGDSPANSYAASLSIGTAGLTNPLQFSVFIDPTTEAISAPAGIANYNDLVELYEAIHDNIKNNSATRWTGKIAIPVQSVKRYGESYPESWVSDATASGVYKKSINIDENFAPWNFPPRGEITSASYTGPGTSVELMNFYAKNVVASRANRFGKTRFASVTKTGLPEISFDDYSLQEVSASGATSGLYGVPNHGISDMSVQFGTGGYQTSYGLKSHFAEFGRPAPLGEEERVFRGNIIKPFRFDVLSLPPITDNSGRDEFRTLPPVISVENGNLIIEDTNKGGGKDPTGSIVNSATTDNLTDLIYPMESAGFALTSAQDEFDNSGALKTRRLYHWTQNNLSDWTSYNTPNFSINTSGNGFIYVPNFSGTGSAQLKYIAKDNVGLNTESPASRTIGCSLDVSMVDEHEYWAGIVLKNSSTDRSLLFGIGTGSSDFQEGRYELVIRFYNSDSSWNSEELVHSVEPMGKNIQLAAKRRDATTTYFYYSIDGSDWKYAGELQTSSGGIFTNPGTNWNDLDRMGVGYDWEDAVSGGIWAADVKKGGVVFDWVAHT